MPLMTMMMMMMMITGPFWLPLFQVWGVCWCVGVVVGLFCSFGHLNDTVTHLAGSHSSTHSAAIPPAAASTPRGVFVSTPSNGSRLETMLGTSLLLLFCRLSRRKMLET